MKGTLFERVRFLDLQPMSVFGYSLVVNLHDTGDSQSPGFVRDYIVKQMLLRDSTAMSWGHIKNVSPDQMLRDKRVAIVTVEGHIPVGAQAGSDLRCDGAGPGT